MVKNISNQDVICEVFVSFFTDTILTPHHDLWPNFDAIYVTVFELDLAVSRFDFWHLQTAFFLSRGLKEGCGCAAPKKVNFESCDPANFPFVGKVTERAAPKQFQKLMNDTSALDSFQPSFHPLHGMQVALVTCMDDLHRQLYQGSSVLLFLLDLRANFEAMTYWPTTLLIWEFMGIPYSGLPHFFTDRNRGWYWERRCQDTTWSVGCLKVQSYLWCSLIS